MNLIFIVVAFRIVILDNFNLFSEVKLLLQYTIIQLLVKICTVVECPFCDREVLGSNTDPVLPKTVKMAVAALSIGAQHYESGTRNDNRSAVCQYNVTGWNIISCI